MTDLKEGGFWQQGPDFLSKHFSEWPIRSDFRTDKLEGELLPKQVHMVFIVSEEGSQILGNLLTKVSSAAKLFKITAFIMKWPMITLSKTDEVTVNSVTVRMMNKSKTLWLRFVQKEIEQDLRMSSDETSKKT